VPRLIAHVSAQLRPMEDSVNWQAIPVGTPIVAGYVAPSHFAWPPEAWARFAGSIEVRITPSASNWGVGIQVLDVETGDATPGQVPGWVANSRNAHQEPTVYCNVASWAAVIRACTSAGVAVPEFWIAQWNGVDDLPSITVDNVTYTAVAHQLADPPASGGDWDSSVVAANWPGVDQGGTVMTDPAVIANDTWMSFVYTDTIDASSDIGQYLVNVLKVPVNPDGKTVGPITTNKAYQWLTVMGMRVGMLTDQLAALSTKLDTVLAAVEKGASAVAPTKLVGTATVPIEVDLAPAPAGTSN
jgi:hypothetical protein